MQGLHTIRARTSKVLAATASFTALSAELAALSRALWAPATVDRLNQDAAEREAFERRLRALLDELEALRERFESELSRAVPAPRPPKKPWWRMFS